MFGLFKKATEEQPYEAVYRAIVGQARTPVFFTEDGVPDTPEGRYDMIMVVAFLVMDRLRKGTETEQAFSQNVFDAMFKDMDRNLREMGIGDVGVPHRIKAMAQAFFGRIKVYQEGLDQEDDAQLIDALDRNLYRDTEVAPEQIARIAAYMRRCRAHLAELPSDNILAGTVDFPDPLSVRA